MRASTRLLSDSRHKAKPYRCGLTLLKALYRMCVVWVDGDFYKMVRARAAVIRRTCMRIACDRRTFAYCGWCGELVG